MIKTTYGKEHALWDQIVRKETDARKRFEYLTGETAAKKFYNGQLCNSVDRKLQTFSKLSPTTTTNLHAAKTNGAATDSSS